ncbi:TniQ family protein [Polynucleobacter sp. AP-Jannik-300A-C4]|uniref:TniQ family protein n=1 Tax=Polynucleobacter sp. AP-Jannik-300A-C4 TaxID=2576928 RepID=UPI001BFD0BE8|nr:TniQ family protein [Polynucleobacter sp. AP-Jannik-300A-C4]QWE22983.1 TniQ family protein [Polynucleobacter sp. AP-Jannik-300A-C4]
MQANENNLLVVTPKPFRYESLRGYLLRVSEANGYLSPSLVAKMLGTEKLTPGSRNISTKKFAEILGFPENRLDRYSHTDSESASKLKILGRQLGCNQRHQRLITIKAKICPICVKEDGHINAFWDLSIAIACPRHKVKPITKCQSCLNPISWFRPGLLKCKCGADYTNAPLEPSKKSHTELMGIIYAKLNEKFTDNLPNTYRFPLSHFEKLQLEQLLEILHKNSKVSSFYEPHEDRVITRDDATLGVTNAVNVSVAMFSRWPEGYADFLDRYFNAADKFGKKYLHSTQIKKLINELTNNSNFDKNTDFIINELLLFSNQFTFPSPLKGKPNLTHVSYFDDFPNLPPKEKSSHTDNKILTLTEAADYIGVPHNILGLFWSSGVMSDYLITEKAKSLKFPWLKEVLDEILETIKKKNIVGFRRTSVRNEQFITLEKVLEKKSIDVEIKISILKGILEDKITVRGRFGKKLSSLILYKREIKQYVSQKRVAIQNEGLSIAQAACDIRTNKTGIEFLMRTGYLQYREEPNGKIITRSFIDRFETHFINVSKIAAKHSQSFEKTINAIELLGLWTISIPGVIEKEDHLFLPASFEKRLNNYFLQNEFTSDFEKIATYAQIT